ncbi:hypothetical protein R9C00_11310 [Flammeovirgaceae bacterium SG7u.111]|nr:hypothetical protein [Flammeovirgaceae bacterium SG7u.132]WPO38039.1 hypothetical protein R9C00_11310 [Flammeovirgaceae bacterium SG7u.111]
MATFLQTELEEIAKYITKMELRNETVSQKSIAWHLDHDLRVIVRVCTALTDSDLSAYRINFSFIRTLVFIQNKFPRGKARAPKQVTPKDVITQNELETRLAKAYELVEKVETLQPNANFKHHIFGLLNLRQTKKFLRIHTRHHLAIVQDIEKAES